MDKLKLYPFEIINPKENRLLARYLIEDNTVDEVVVNLDLTQEKNIIKSVFRDWIGKCIVYTS